MSQSPIDMILDENNTDPIVLYNEGNEAISFEQIAVIPRNCKIYVILRPLGDFEGVAEDEALVFTITEQDGEDILLIVDDNETIDAVFHEYYEMLKEAGIE